MACIAICKRLPEGIHGFFKLLKVGTIPTGTALPFVAKNLAYHRPNQSYIFLGYMNIYIIIYTLWLFNIAMENHHS